MNISAGLARKIEDFDPKMKDICMKKKQKANIQYPPQNRKRYLYIT
jgi:hypothetical protein